MTHLDDTWLVCGMRGGVVQERLVREVTVVFKKKTCCWFTNNIWELVVVNYMRETDERGYRVFKRKTCCWVMTMKYNIWELVRGNTFSFVSKDVQLEGH